MAEQAEERHPTGERHDAEHDTSLTAYVMVFLALLVGTGLTVLVAGIDLGPFNDVAALVIAFTKATLVVLFFMHVRHSSKLTKLTVIAGLFWLFIMISMTLSDYLTRGWLDTFGASR
jgi:cytochrome c oxidase subunit 4